MALSLAWMTVSFRMFKVMGAKKTEKIVHKCTLDAFFRQIKLFIRFCLFFVYVLQTLYLIDFSKIYQLKGLKPKKLMSILVKLNENV